MASVGVKERDRLGELGLVRVAVQVEVGRPAGGTFAWIDTAEAHRAGALSSAAELDELQLAVLLLEDRVQLVGVALVGLEEGRLADRLYADRERVAKRDVVTHSPSRTPASRAEVVCGLKQPRIARACPASAQPGRIAPALADVNTA